MNRSVYFLLLLFSKKTQISSLRELKESDLRAVLLHHDVPVWRNLQIRARQVTVLEERPRSLRIEHRKTTEYDSITIIEISQQAAIDLVENTAWLRSRYLRFAAVNERWPDTGNIPHSDRPARRCLCVETSAIEARHK